MFTPFPGPIKRPGPQSSLRCMSFSLSLGIEPVAVWRTALARCAAIIERELLPIWRNRLLTEITPDDLHAQCAKIVERGAPAAAIHVSDILKQIFGFAILHGE